MTVAVLLGLGGCALAPRWSSSSQSLPPVIRAQSMTTADPRSGGPAGQQLPSEHAPALALSLRDAVELALQNSDVVRVLGGRVRLASQTVYDTMIAAWEVQAAEGAFQPLITSKIEGSQVDEPPNAFFGPGISAQTQRDTLDFNLRLTKPLRTGGELSVGIEPPLAYLYFPEGVDPDEFNPSWSTAYVFRFRQPLLRGHGRDIATAPIQVAQLQSNQTQWALQEELNSLIRSVIEAYWNLYTAYVEQQAVEAVIPMAKESVRIEKLRFKAEQTIYADVARAEYQLEEMRLDAIRAAAEIRRRTIQLRQLIGGPTQLRPLIFPENIPIQTPPAQHPDGLIQVALGNRPELNQMRELVAQRGVELNVAENGVLPRLDFLADYQANGLKERLDTSLGQARDFDYTDWTLGVSMEIPVGNLTARSEEQAASLRLTRDRMRLQRQEQNVAFEIVGLHSDLQAEWSRFEVATRQASQTQEWLRLSKVRYKSPPASSNERNWLLLELSDFQRAMTAWVDAVTSSGDAIARYNILQARLDEASGTAVSRWTTMAPAMAASPVSAATFHPAQPQAGGQSTLLRPSWSQEQTSAQGQHGHSLLPRETLPEADDRTRLTEPPDDVPRGGHSTLNLPSP